MTVIRLLSRRPQRHPQTLVIPHFIGASPRSTGLRDMLLRFCRVLKNRFGFAEEAPEERARLTVAFLILEIGLLFDLR